MTDISIIKHNVGTIGTGSANSVKQQGVQVKQNDDSIFTSLNKTQEKKDLPTVENEIDTDSLSEEEQQVFQDLVQLMNEYQDPAELLEAAEGLGYSQSDIEELFGAPSDEAGPLVEGDPQTEEEANMPPRDVDPDTYAQQYADENGLTLEEAKAELSAKYGDPEAPDAEASAQGTDTASNTTATTDNTKTENTVSNEDSQLIEAGIPEEVVLQGADAVMNFLKEQLNVPEDILSQGEEAVMDYLKENLE